MPTPATDPIQEAAKLLARGELVAFPTETVYGLGANAWDRRAVAGIFEAKGRPATNPLIVHIHDVSELAQCVALPLPPSIQTQLEHLLPFWPGPLTLILPRSSKIPFEVTAGRESVAVRIPDHPVARQLLAACPFPLAAPSANRSTAVSPTTAEHVRDELGDRVAMVLDGGPSRVGLESTILSLVETPPRILRHGFVTAEMIATALNMKVETLLRAETSAAPVDGQGLASPGQMRVHYAPRTPVFLRPDWKPQTVVRAALVSFGGPPAGAVAEQEFVETRRLSGQGDLSEIAHRLFATLRELDARNLDAIVVDTCDERGLGRAIMDRLKRAAARTSG